MGGSKLTKIQHPRTIGQLRDLAEDAYFEAHGGMHEWADMMRAIEEPLREALRFRMTPGKADEHMESLRAAAAAMLGGFAQMCTYMEKIAEVASEIHRAAARDRADGFTV